ncbi:hypothetical protein M378DRAFT_81207, partial [Amanita muscaria Koide BX008]
PAYLPTSPRYSPTCPSFFPMSPRYSLQAPSFSLTSPQYSQTSPLCGHSKYLAYTEWFTPFSPSSVQPDILLYKLSRAKRDDEEVVSIVPINSIRQSVHLFPHFGAAVPCEWSDVLLYTSHLSCAQIQLIVRNNP